MAVQEFTWKFSEIKARWREDTGLSSTDDISDDDLGARLNDYYVHHFPHDAEVDEFNGFLEQSVSATDDGEYDLSTDVDRLDDPVTCNRREIKLYRNREEFFSDYPENEQYVTEPVLVIGSDTTKVAHSAFTYRIQNYTHSKALSEVDLTGDTVPQNKYGAWLLKIDSDGDITVTAATDNGTGYATPRLALEALNKSDSESCFMGYVTVINTDSGGFIPATITLNDDAVTATYTDGKFEGRNTPEAILLYGTKLYARPRPNDIYEIKALTIAEKPSAFADDDAVPADALWGPAIARGAALLWLEPRGGQQRITDLAVSTKYYFDAIRSNRIKRLLGGQVQRSF